MNIYIMNFEKLVALFEKLDTTTKRLEKTYQISEFLKICPDENLDVLIYLLQGKVFSETDSRKLGVASKIVVKALNISTGISLDDINKIWRDTGDLGICAQNVTAKKTQRTLFCQKLSISKVHSNLVKLSEFEGSGTVDKKIKFISELLTSASPVEARYITRIVLEDLRLGVGEGTLRDAITWANFPPVYGVFKKCGTCEKIMPNGKLCLYCGSDLIKKYESHDTNFTSIDNISNDGDFVYLENESSAREIYNQFLSIVQNAYDLVNDFSKVARVLKNEGISGLGKIKLESLNPLKLMLYLKAKDFDDAFTRVGRPCAIEFKYDGFRVQCHKKNGVIKLFTRSLEDVTKQFPDVVKFIEKSVSCDDFIIDGEVIGIDSNGNYLPFQKISQRIKRKHDIEELVKTVPVVLRIFDIMLVDSNSLLNESFKVRRGHIERIITEDENITLAEQRIVSSEPEALAFYENSLQKGNEGAMMKSLDAPYKPGKRVGHGVKIKPTMDTLDLVVTGAEWGEGKRSEWFASFTIACLDDDGSFLDIGKVGTGFKEKSDDGLSFDQMTKLLKPLVVYEKGKSVRVSPKIIIEIEFEEIQKSPSYASGYALRFPRVKGIREEKPVSEVSSLEFVEESFYHQN